MFIAKYSDILKYISCLDWHTIIPNASWDWCIGCDPQEHNWAISTTA